MFDPSAEAVRWLEKWREPLPRLDPGILLYGALLACMVLPCVGYAAIGAMVSVDCIWSTRIEAWVDNDADGIWDAGEPPLKGVTFHVRRPDNTAMPHLAATGAQGQAELAFGGCYPSLEVYPDVPAGYYLSTPDYVATGSRPEGPPLRFGFAALP